MTVKDKFFLSIIFLFTASLFLSFVPGLGFGAAALLLIAALTYNSFTDKLRLFKERRYIIWMLLFMTCIGLSMLLSDNKHTAVRNLDPRLPMLYFPLSIGLISIRKELFTKAMAGIAVIITFFALFCLCYSIYRSYSLHNTVWLYNDALSAPVGMQSIYFSLLVNMAIYIFAWLLFHQPAIRYKGWLVLAILFLFLISFLLASRNLMLVLYLSTFGFALYSVIRQKKYLVGTTLILGLLLGVFLAYKFFPKTVNRFRELTYTQFDFRNTGPESHYDMPVTADQWTGVNIRLAIWPCGWELFKKNPWLGIHIGDKETKLMEVYRAKDFRFAIQTQKNLHNNYLDILVSMGITGLLLFLISWMVVPFRIFQKQRDGLSVLILLTFACAMFTENYFDRSLGGMLFGFFITFLLSPQSVKN